MTEVRGVRREFRKLQSITHTRYDYDFHPNHTKEIEERERKGLPEEGKEKRWWLAAAVADGESTE